MSTNNLTLLGNKKTEYDFSKPNKNILETFENTAGNLVVPFVCHEFTSLCPVTNQPDFATFEILYIPDKKGVESKSLKMYLFSFRNHGEFHEEVTARIANDIFETIQPRCIRVFGDFHVRGGIAIQPLVLRFANDVDETERAEIEKKIEHYDRIKRTK